MYKNLDANFIRTILNNLVSQTCGFEAYAVTTELPRLKKLTMTENTNNGGLKNTLKEMVLGIIQERFLSADVTYSQVESVADNQDKFYIIPQTEEYRPFGFLNGPQESFKVEHLKDLTGVVFVFRYDSQSVYCFQKSRSITIPNRKETSIVTKVLCGDDSVILDQQKDKLLTISRSIDAIIIDDHVITDNITMMERSFDFETFVSQKAKTVVQSIVNSGFFANTSKIDEYLTRGSGKKKTYYRKMMRAMDSPVLKMSSEELFRKIATVDRWKGKFKKPVDGMIPLDTYVEIESLIDLLDERYTVSEVSGQEYDTDVKKKVENA